MNVVSEVAGRLWTYECPREHTMLVFFRLAEDETMKPGNYTEDAFEVEFWSPPPSDECLHQVGYRGGEAHFLPTAYTLPILPPKGERFCLRTSPEFMKLDQKDPTIHLTDSEHYRWSTVKLFFKRDAVEIDEIEM